MKNLTPELIAKAMTAKSADELLELAKANGVELTADEAATYFAQLNAKGAVFDDELDGVSGGILGCPDDEEEDSDPLYVYGTKVKVVDGTVCPKCKSAVGTIALKSKGAAALHYVKCDFCGAAILDYEQFSKTKITFA